MSNVVRQSLAAGHKKYKPIDLDTYNHSAAFIEPGRLEVTFFAYKPYLIPLSQARISEFYRKLENDDERRAREDADYD
jgi:hypothetical protein